MTDRAQDPAGAAARHSVLDLFSMPTSRWFRDAFGAPTPAQEGAWRSIASGNDTLVVAPTGSGKTLAAFLAAIDRLAFGDEGGTRAPRGTSVLYVSPLKALGVDVQRNLTAPLEGIMCTAEETGHPHHPIEVGVRSGDTPPAQRRRLVSHPPDVLITTPESLFLMLSSAARDTLRAVGTVIVDEVHAVAGTKRGVHLALSLARLDALASHPVQRIGLSATVEPAQEVAAFLSGDRGCEAAIVRPPSRKHWDLSVRLPVPDLSAIIPPADAVDEDDVSGTIWPHVERAVLDEVLAHRSTIVFTNSRRQAERLTSKLNLLHRTRSAPDADEEFEDVARAHHGSMSKEHRAQIEEQLKAGTLRCVVATSSLELGIDMGAVDLVIQVETPFSVSSTVQRIGRAGHDVGAVSRGIVHPLHAADVLRAAVMVGEAMAGRIEPLTVPRNALDVLAQHTVSAAIEGNLDVEEWFEVVRTAHPYAQLPRSAFDQTIDLLSGRYPSTAFSELRPHLVHDHEAGVLIARSSAQRLVVTSGGTIPDRGLFPVYIVAGEEDSQARRVGELDEEMVYESRRGDVITLGTSSWRIEEITHDRVSVSPAFGLSGRIPFWHGDGVGRPPSLGRAIASFQADLSQLEEPAARERLASLGLDENASRAVMEHLTEQREAVGAVPGPQSLVVERFPDELGDWLIVLHCPLGQRLNAPWALAVGARVEERYGLQGQVMASDDGIVLRIPHGEEPPGAELFLFSPEEIDEEVRALVGGSALFASRFRECAARALLLPRRDPRSRAPLWQQRQRSAQLLDVARAHPQFPIMLEAARECLQDVYDLPALVELMGHVASRRVQVQEVENAAPSPFARSLLFGYVAQFIYDTDAPLAERRSAVLALDQSMLAELLGSVSLRDLLDGAVIDDVTQQLQGLFPQRALVGPEDLADSLRRLGPLDAQEICERCAPGVDGAAVIGELVSAGRAIEVSIVGQCRVAAVEDAALLRDALGTAIPPDVPAVHLSPVDDSVEQLLSRWARVRGPFAADEVIAEWGLAPGVARAALEALTVSRVLTQGEFTPGREGTEWVDSGVLRRIRRASLVASRRQIEPVQPKVYARFLAEWQRLALHRPDGTRDRSSWSGADGLLSVVDQLTGVSLPLSAWEPHVLPARLPDYAPTMLDSLFAAGELSWTGHGRLGRADGWVRLHLTDTLPLGVDAQEVERSAAALEDGSVQARVLELLRSSPGALRHGEILRTLADTGEAVAPADLTQALWELAFSTLITNDSFAALRTYALGPAPRPAARHGGRSRPSSRWGAARLSAAMMRGAAAPAQLEASTGPAGAGRWSAVRVDDVDPSAKAAAVATLLLDRHGVVTRGAMDVESVPGSFAAVYRVLSTMEENGSCRRGYFIDGLGASQFALAGAVDLLRSHNRERSRADSSAYAVLAATDPANPYGAALPWPSLPVSPPDGAAARPARRAGAIVVLRDGAVTAFVDRGGKHLLWWAEDAWATEAAAQLVQSVKEQSVLPALSVERVNGRPITAEPNAPVVKALVDAGCYRSPSSVRVRPERR